MEINEFRKFIRDVEFTDEQGGCALAFATDSEGGSTAFIKGNAEDIHELLLNTMRRSNPIRECILRVANLYRIEAENANCIL